MVEAAVTGVGAGAVLGYVLQRGQLCFHSMFAGAWEGRRLLARAWLLGVAIASVGLSAIYLSPTLSSGLNTGLAFEPVADVAGGAVIGIGMLIASSCVSGLFYKLGSGMVGALVGIAGWVGGEAAARKVTVPGPVVLSGGAAGTLAGVAHVPRLAMSSALLLVVLAALRSRSGRDRPSPEWQWDWPRLGTALGLATVAGWLLARAGHSPFGPSTVGATASVLGHHPNWWLIAFLVGLVPGAFAASATSGGLEVRAETRTRYARLAAGGFLLGAGGWIAGGCNLGHGLSGVAQLNVSSWVVVSTMAVTVGAGRAVVATGRSRAGAVRLAGANRAG